MEICTCNFIETVQIKNNYFDTEQIFVFDKCFHQYEYDFAQLDIFLILDIIAFKLVFSSVLISLCVVMILCVVMVPFSR